MRAGAMRRIWVDKLMMGTYIGEGIGDQAASGDASGWARCAVQR